MEATLAVIVAAVIILVVVGGIVAFVVGVLRSIAAVHRRNTAFLAGAIAARDLPLGVLVAVPFQPVPGSAHAVWLDLSARSGDEIRFDLDLSVRIGNTLLIQGRYPVRFDSDADVSGLPNMSGTIELNASSRTGLGGNAVTTVLRAFRFDAPPMPLVAEVQARIAAPRDVVVERARLLVTVEDSPV